MHRFFIVSLAIFVLVCAGCSQSKQTLKDSWKYTSKQYRAYLNTPAELDMEDSGDREDYELALSDAVLDLDWELQKLIRAMENSDRSPDQEWVTQLIRRFPWLTGVALADKDGNLMAQHPEYFSKEFDVAPLLVPDPKQLVNSLRAYVQQTPLGPEIYLANPVFVGTELRGLITVYFDPRSLVSLSRDPGSFMLASPDGVIWAGRFTPESTPVGTEKWSETLLRGSSGVIGGSGAEFFWTTRYLGNLPLVYAVPTDATKVSENPAQLDQLKSVDISDAPPLKLADPTLMEGEVGNVGAPNVQPAPAPAPGAQNDGTPLKE